MSASQRYFENYEPGGSGGDVLGIALAVNRVLDERVDIEAVRKCIDGLAASKPTDLAPWCYLGEEGFCGTRRGYRGLDGSRMDCVFEQRKGIPITLGVLLVHIAEYDGMRAWGINFPGHFLVRLDDQLVDPFEMRPIEEAECVARLPDGVEAGDDAFKAMTPVMVGVRMLNNVKYHYVGARQWDQALGIIDHQIRLVPREALLFFERGEFWRNAGSADMARDAYLKAGKLAQDADLLRAIEARLDGVRRGSDTLH
ncbi:MAG: transglutaminase family protein [Pseudomonadales bacterium]|nr:transglutaminase family protein [Pseudomonadales bacterium]MDP6471602.1 transglutaminase family protein [Pseudomonadales bacterium]MDP6828865.1 transglutaminase family protein [Pseudomonadales bacterium]MDP6970603.1 transglutaminase family protein [Pseudomonadales bacterium]